MVLSVFRCTAIFALTIETNFFAQTLESAPNSDFRGDQMSRASTSSVSMLPSAVLNSLAVLRASSDDRNTLSLVLLVTYLIPCPNRIRK